MHEVNQRVYRCQCTLRGYRWGRRGAVNLIITVTVAVAVIKNVAVCPNNTSTMIALSVSSSQNEAALSAVKKSDSQYRRRGELTFFDKSALPEAALRVLQNLHLHVKQHRFAFHRRHLR